MRPIRSTSARRRSRSVGLACLTVGVVLGMAWQDPASPAQAETATPQTKPAKDETTIDPPLSPVEIMQELMKKRVFRPPIPPSDPGREPMEPPPAATTEPAVSPDRADRPLRPDGSVIADRIGRLIRRPKGWYFVFESEGKVLREPPMQILPNRDLEIMEIQSANGTRPVKFRVSGEVTVYRGANYLLLRKVLTVHDLGNLK